MSPSASKPPLAKPVKKTGSRRTPRKRPTVEANPKLQDTTPNRVKVPKPPLKTRTTPLKATKNPSEAPETTSKASATPSKAAATPSKAAATPSKPLTNRFSLNPDEAPSASTKTPHRHSGNPRKRKEPASASEPPAHEGEAGTKEGDMTPDVLFHKQMTRDKLALLNRSPLSKVLSKEQKDAAAEEIYGKGATFDANMPQTRAGEQRQDGARGENKKERRKLQRKVRELKVAGQLPGDEREGTEVGVMYLGHIPHGFYEKEITAYFSQYGEVTRVRLSRSKRTARSKGFAFVEFADKDVAVAAAKSMDGYLMHGQKLVAKLVEKEKLHPDTFRGANRVFKKIPFAAIERRKMIQRARDPVKLAKRSKAVQKKLKKKQNMLLKKGIHYDFPTLTPTAIQEK